MGWPTPSEEKQLTQLTQTWNSDQFPQIIVQSDQRQATFLFYYGMYITSSSGAGRTSLWWKKVGLVLRGLTRSDLAILSLFLKKNKFYLFIYVAAMGLHCCVRAFSSCGKWGLLFIVVPGLLTVVASHVEEYRL